MLRICPGLTSGYCSVCVDTEPEVSMNKIFLIHVCKIHPSSTLPFVLCVPRYVCNLILFCLLCVHLLFLRDPHQHTGLRKGMVVSFDLLTLGNCKKEIFSHLSSTTELF